MTIGIVPNISKDKIVDVVNQFILILEKYNLDYLISNELLKIDNGLTEKIEESVFLDYNGLFTNSDIIVSIGGDGTMLATSYQARNYSVPLIGVNFGKLGFLAEFEIGKIEQLIKDIKAKNYQIDDRILLEAELINGDETEKLNAINDIVIDKGRWPKMIEITVKLDDEYVSTFLADGVIIATPTGSTGYSLSTGGPIVTPNSDVLTLSPISPHTLTMRPLIFNAEKTIEMLVESPYETVQVSCDGQRVYYYNSPMKIRVKKSKNAIKLVHTKENSYFEILRNKLYWGLDVRKNNS